jgi:hypothetical protein
MAEEEQAVTCETDLAVEGAWLVCSLSAGHDGLHYDVQDDISFRKGRP